MDPHAAFLKLESPDRDNWQKPDAVIAALNLKRDATVVDIGSGTGYFVVRLARHLDLGTVVGLDSQPEMVAYLTQRSIDLGLSNVEACLVNGSDELQLSQPVDLILCVDTYHHIPDRVEYFSRFAKHLKRDGRLAIIDRPTEAADGPPLEMRVSAGDATSELAEAGFILTDSLEMLLPTQYFLIFGLSSMDFPL